MPLKPEQTGRNFDDELMNAVDNALADGIDPVEFLNKLVEVVSYAAPQTRANDGDYGEYDALADGLKTLAEKMATSKSTEEVIDHLYSKATK